MKKENVVLSTSYNLSKGWLEFEFVVYLNKGDLRIYSTTIKPKITDVAQLVSDIKDHIEDCPYIEDINSFMDRSNIIIRSIFDEFKEYDNSDVYTKSFAPFNTIREFDIQGGNE
jgi:hypothetical protein